MPFGTWPNYLMTIGAYLTPESRDFPSLKKPDGVGALFDDALSTIDPEVKRVQKLLKIYFDDVTVIPIHEVGRASVQSKNVHDTGHLKYGSWPNWAPDKAWLSK